jgi:hypothetical protein
VRGDGPAVVSNHVMDTVQWVHAYVEQLLERIYDLVGLDVPEDVDDFAMPRLAVGVHDVFQRKRLNWMDNGLLGRWQPRFWVCDDLKPDMAGI